MPLGGIISILALLPNIGFMLFPPSSIPTEVQEHDRVYRLMEILERVGQIGSFALPFFYALKVRAPADWAFLGAMLLTLGFYYAGWLRYFLRGRTFSLLFAPMARIPLPMALGPVLYFMASAFFLHSWYMGAASLLLAIGHLYVSNCELQRCIHA